jgi:hypothetical protein
MVWTAAFSIKIKKELLQETKKEVIIVYAEATIL